MSVVPPNWWAYMNIESPTLKKNSLTHPPTPVYKKTDASYRYNYVYVTYMLMLTILTTEC